MPLKYSQNLVFKATYFRKILTYFLYQPISLINIDSFICSKSSIALLYLRELMEQWVI